MRKITIILICAIFLSYSLQQWGLIRYVHTPTNIRANRSSKSEIVGVLKAGEKIKVDYLKNNWFAIFKVNETVRSESGALGYVYAPLLKPNSPSNSGNEGKSTASLKYRIVEKKDISYRGTSRMTFRVVITNKAASKNQMKATAIQIWKNENKGWDEFTIFMYLPGMDTQNAAYGIAEFRPNGLLEFKTNDWVLELQKLK